MPYIIVGVALYLLYRYFHGSGAASTANGEETPAGQTSYGGQGQPAAGGGETPAGGQPAPSPTVTWQPIPEGSQLQPGFDYRASAPPQNALVTAMIPGHLASAGFTNILVYAPGDAYPNDWPDSGTALRIAATLPAGAQPQTFSLDGVSVWQKVAQTTGQRIRGAIVRIVPADVVRAVQVRHPESVGVYAGLVRRH